MARLIKLAPRHEDAFFEYVEDFKRHNEPSALPEFPRKAYGYFLEMLEKHTHCKGLPRGVSPYTRYFIASDDETVLYGSCTFRFMNLPEIIIEGGHIGYSVAPSHRGHGYAKRMCRAMIRLGLRHGYQRVLITCDEDNLTSAHIIESCGGVLEDIRVIPGRVQRKKRYWVQTSLHKKRGT